jgi:quinol monooxygenase YgiN
VHRARLRDARVDRRGAVMSSEVEVAVLTATFDAAPGSEDALAASLARYVVMTRNAPACRNVDLVLSATHSGRFLVIEKWDSAADVQAHLDSALMAGMAREVVPLLQSKPAIDLFDTISAHDLA